METEPVTCFNSINVSPPVEMAFCSQRSDESTQFLSTVQNQKKIMQYMNSTLNGFNRSFRTTKSNTNKDKIQILSLTRSKFKVHPKRGKLKIRQQGSLNTHRVNYVDDYQKRIQEETMNKQMLSISRSKQYEAFFTMLSVLHDKKKKNNRKIQFFISDIPTFISKTKNNDIKNQFQEISYVADDIQESLILNSKQKLFNYDLMKDCKGDIAKIIVSLSYQLYLYKTNKFNLKNLENLHKDLEYSSRRLSMLNLTLKCCMDLGKIYCSFFEFEKAIEYYRKSIKLAVFIGDKYNQELGLDKLAMCQFYKGNIVEAKYIHDSSGNLSPYDVKKIKDFYSNEEEIKKLMEAKTKENFINKQQYGFFEIEKQNISFNFVNTLKDKQYPHNNYLQFRKNMKEMIKVKDLRKKLPKIKDQVQKNQRIGFKKYHGKDYCVPKASKYCYNSEENLRSEVLLSHKSYSRNNVLYESQRIQKDCIIIGQILNYFINQKRVTPSQYRIQQRQISQSSQISEI